MKKKRNILYTVFALVLVGAGVIGRDELRSFIQEPSPLRIEQTTKEEPSKQTQQKPDNSVSDTYTTLANTDFHSGNSPVLDVNNNQSTLDISNWKENRVLYGNLDELNRTTKVTAFIDKKNLGRSEGRERQIWKPTGWKQKKVDGKEIMNRGHLLAYTSSFNFDMDGNYKEGENGSSDNPKNLATQTAFANQNVQTTYEKKVRDAQKITGNKVIYQIVTVFRGNELMPRGYWLQAIDSNGILNFNVYVYNVQPKVVFNYEDGTSTIDRSLTIR